MIGGIEVIPGVLTHQRVDALVRGIPVGMIPDPNRDPILAAAGPELLAELQSVGVPPVGDAVVTAGYRLIARFVIHVVAPWATDASVREQQVLGQCHEAFLMQAERYRIRTIAMAPLGPGFSPDVAARVGIGTLYRIMSVNYAVYRVSIVCPTDDLFRIYDRVLTELDD